MSQTISIKLRSLRGIELQLPQIDLQELAPHPQSAQPKAVLVSRTDNILNSSRRIVGEPIHDLDRLGILNKMQVIQEQNNSPLNGRQLGSESLDLWLCVA